MATTSDGMWLLCAREGCKRHVPDDRPANAIYCSRKCSDMAGSLRHSKRQLEIKEKGLQRELPFG